jgi:ABC-type nitrate/sulfonate/bicarbonate transport system ATPase subunit
MGTAVIFACEHVTKRYGGDAVVEDVSLALRSGGFIALVGPSGVGKTTLFNVASGVDRPDAGRVLLAGEDVTGQAGRVRYMLQKDLLLEYRTALDNVILPLLIRGEAKGAAREKAAALFPRFGLAGCEGKYPHQLSGGMRQRAALLRTCIAGAADHEAAPVILLDEPFSALDALTRAAMHEWYVGIAAEMRLSTMLITHDVEEAVGLSERVYVLHGKPGKITNLVTVNPKGAADAKAEILGALR